MRRMFASLALVAAGIAPVFAQEPAALALFTQPAKGNCIACHQLPAGSGPASRNDLGPALTGARMRQLGKPALTALLHDPGAARPDSLMPPYGRHGILTAQEIARLVEFLHALP